MRPAMIRRGSFTASVHGEDVARRPTHDVLRDAPLDEPLEEALLAHADDDDVGVPFLGQRHDRVSRLAGRLDELDLEPALGEIGSRLVEALAPVAPRPRSRRGRPARRS